MSHTRAAAVNGISTNNNGQCETLRISLPDSIRPTDGITACFVSESRISSGHSVNGKLSS